jgi:hypothetical protein
VSLLSQAERNTEMLTIEMTAILGLLFTAVVVGMVATRLSRKSAPQRGAATRGIRRA